ncbi:MAG: bifunctional riboflavin kinase/FAD synthetase [Gammaproteobacteria bacterium]
MELIRGRHNLRPAHRGCAVTIGNFDGLHLGHQAVLAQLAGRAGSLDLPAVVMSFEPTPREYFAGSSAPPRLLRFREKFEGLAAAGVDRLFLVRFGRRVADLSPQAFIQEFLVDGLDVQYLVIGDDFRFGRNRAGDFDTLVQAGQEHGFEVTDTPTRMVDDIRVSSTAVRKALGEGDLELAERLLGRPYSMTGRVIPGDRLGRRLGYPTANLRPGRQVLPLNGVFAARVIGAAERSLPAVVNLGTRPTVEGTEPLLEAHLFDFEGDLYGKRLTVEFVRRLRDEERFENVERLRMQMDEDAARARAVLAGQA